MQNSHHIRSAFDRALESLQANMLKMGGIVEVNIMDAAKALEERDIEVAEKVRERDKQIDNLEEVISALKNIFMDYDKYFSRSKAHAIDSNWEIRLDQYEKYFQ